MFKHTLGVQATTKVNKFSGIITSRSENLYGCNRYFITAKTTKDSKIPDGYWFDEDDVVVTGKGVTATPKNTGGPISKLC